MDRHRIVHEHIEPAVTRGDVLDQRGIGFRIRDIELESFDRSAHALNQCFGLIQLFLPPPADDNGCAAAGQQRGGCPADPIASAGNDRDLSGEILAHNTAPAATLFRLASPGVPRTQDVPPGEYIMVTQRLQAVQPDWVTLPFCSALTKPGS